MWGGDGWEHGLHGVADGEGLVRASFWYGSLWRTHGRLFEEMLDGSRDRLWVGLLTLLHWSKVPLPCVLIHMSETYLVLEPFNEPLLRGLPAEGVLVRRGRLVQAAAVYALDGGVGSSLTAELH